MQMLRQTPSPGSTLRAVAGDVLTLTLQLPEPRAGRAWLRTNIGRAAVRRRELVESTEAKRPALARDWHDIPMDEESPALHRVRVPLTEVGVFAAKTCFVPAGERSPVWPAGGDLVVKVAPAHTVAANSVYTAFPRQFGTNRTLEHAPALPDALAPFDLAGYAVIPPSGTFRDVAARLDTILDDLRFRVVQLLPVHPVPTTFARMGRFGSPFAGQDFLAVDPALAVFDREATPMDQFRELLDGVHARGGRLFLDLPANHTGWASTLQLHHPEWFRRDAAGRFHSPGAWGTVWEDLVELDYAHLGLRDFMAHVFEFWCGEGVDGFRCDAGYMIPADVWTYIVARVRSSFPDTVFLLEGLGGKISVTRSLLEAANLDWAYSELFQTEDRAAFERYAPEAMALSHEVGPLIHFAETHDNLRLAARSRDYARMRVTLTALLSDQGAFGVTNGVEWFATERVDVHGASALRWGHEPNLCAAIRRLNTLLETHPAFESGTHLRFVQERDGNSLAVLRTPADPSRALLVLANLDADHPQPVHWPSALFDPQGDTPDLLGGHVAFPERFDGLCRLTLEPGQVLCLARQGADSATLGEAVAAATHRTPCRVHRQHVRAAALRVRGVLRPDEPLAAGDDPDEIADAFERDPIAFVERMAGPDAFPPLSIWRWPQDARRVAPVPPGHLLMVEAPCPFRARIDDQQARTVEQCDSIALPSGRHVGLLAPLPTCDTNTPCVLRLWVYEAAGTRRNAVGLVALRHDGRPEIRTAFTGPEVRAANLLALLTNGRGAMSHVPARWPELRSRYDALLAANPDPRVPCDRQVLFSRCRLWVRHRGYSQAVDAACLERFASTAGTGEALWLFHVPVGLGRWTPLSVSLRLEADANRLHLTVTRDPAPAEDDGALPDRETVRVILRPDIESRSFHETTKAYTGPEHAWRAASHPEPHAVVFSPEGRPGLTLRSDRCAYVHEPEWQYMVGRPLEAERGLEAFSDLFSPGYFHLQIRGGESLHLTAAMEPDDARSSAESADASPRSFGDRIALGAALPLALDDFVVARDALQTVIAGYPWFLDWGRDTFIVLRGMIAAGMTDAALAILREFGRFERDGTLPNMIRGNDDSNRDTSDAPLWYAVAARDLARSLGPRAVLDADCGGRPLSRVLASLATGYLHGTPNGIRVDPDSALVFSPAHYTWMDTNHPAGTPREGYPVEIQALWIAALSFLADVFPDGEWTALRQRATTSLRRFFWRESDGFLSDCLHASPGVPAAQATADDHLRCNQLFAITLGALDDRAMGRRILRACETLLVPGAIRTLADRPVSVPLAISRNGQGLNDPHRPYWGRYEGDEDTRRKPAYHNGTAWVWPFPSYAEAMVAVYGPTARSSAVALLESCIELFDDGVVGHLPEIVDGDAPHAQRGCYAQAWSVSEVLRVAALLG